MVPNRMLFVIFEEETLLERRHILQAGCKRRAVHEHFQRSQTPCSKGRDKFRGDE
jgi:hypothetical protein